MPIFGCAASHGGCRAREAECEARRVRLRCALHVRCPVGGSYGREMGRVWGRDMRCDGVKFFWPWGSAALVAVRFCRYPRCDFIVAGGCLPGERKRRKTRFVAQTSTACCISRPRLSKATTPITRITTDNALPQSHSAQREIRCNWTVKFWNMTLSRAKNPTRS